MVLQFRHKFGLLYATAEGEMAIALFEKFNASPLLRFGTQKMIDKEKPKGYEELPAFFALEDSIQGWELPDGAFKLWLTKDDYILIKK